MGTTVSEYNGINFKPILIFLAAVAVIIALFALDAIPLTSHAQQSHQHEKINASAIVAAITAGSCRNIEVYFCEDEGTTKVLCKMGNNLWGGLIIGSNYRGEETVITGYGARYSYWKNNVDGCSFMGGPLAVP
jgi:hypothetical protein